MLYARKIKTTAGKDTIEVIMKSKLGTFRGSAPVGKSKGSNEVKEFKVSLDRDIKFVKSLDITINDIDDVFAFDDLDVGGNTRLALSYAALKYLSAKHNKPVWYLLNPNANRIPSLLSNTIGGGVHCSMGPKFQEFLVIAEGSVTSMVEHNKRAWIYAGSVLRKMKKLAGRNLEGAWCANITDEQALIILHNYKKGVDVAGATFHNKDYNLIRSIVEDHDVFYIEDPFDEKQYHLFARLKREFKDRLIVGDDLFATNVSLLKKHRSACNGAIVKPNQVGSLTATRAFVNQAKKYKYRVILSHRSGETPDWVLADLAVAFDADYLKLSVYGKERLIKLKRLEAIEKEVEKWQRKQRNF